MNVAEKVFEELRTLPEFEMQEVLDFVGFLKVKHGITAMQPANDTATDWTLLMQHAHDLVTAPIKAPDLALMDEVRGKICTGTSWTRDELYDRGLR